MAQMKEKNQTKKKKKLNKMEISNLSDVEFKTLVIKMLKGLTEDGNNIKEDMKVTLSEIEKNPQGTNSEGKEVGIQINDLEHKEAKQKQPIRTTRRKKNPEKQGQCKKPL